MQAFDHVNQKYCESALSCEEEVLASLGLCLSAGQCLEEYPWLQSCTGSFSLEAGVVDRSQVKLLAQAYGLLMQDSSCATNVWYS